MAILENTDNNFKQYHGQYIALIDNRNFIREMHTVVSMQDVESRLQDVMDADDAPLPNDAVSLFCQ
jgi:hypothetical protein